MKIRPMLKFELHDSLRLLVGFYLIPATFFVFLSPFVRLFSGKLSWESLLSWIINLIPNLFLSLINLGNGRAFDVIIISFLFVLGLISFSPGFRIGQSLGASRRTTFVSYLLHTGIVSFVVALTGSALSLKNAFAAVPSYSPVGYPNFLWVYHAFYRANLFGTDLSAENASVTAVMRSPQFILDYFLWTFCIGAMMLMLGYLIGLCFYRLTRGVRKRFAVAAPVLVIPLISYALTFLFPCVDSYLFGESVSIFIYYPEQFLQSASQRTPYFAVLCYLVLFVVFAILSYLLIRRLTFDVPDPLKKASVTNPAEAPKSIG